MKWLKKFIDWLKRPMTPAEEEHMIRWNKYQCGYRPIKCECGREHWVKGKSASYYENLPQGTGPM